MIDMMFDTCLLSKSVSFFIGSVSIKNVNDYLRLESTDAYLEALSLETGYPVSSFISI